MIILSIACTFTSLTCTDLGNHSHSRTTVISTSSTFHSQAPTAPCVHDHALIFQYCAQRLSQMRLSSHNCLPYRKSLPPTMLLPSLLPFAILAVAVSIPEPLPIFGPFCGTPAPVYANGTKAANWTDYIASFETLPSPGGQGITDAWGNDGGPIPWPRTGTHQAVIPYCFTQEWDRRYIRNIVENGMAKWIE